jgi:hypothetical protein
LTAARARAAELRATFHRWKGETDLASFDAAMHTVLAELEDLGDDEGMAAVLLLLGVINVNRFEQSAAHFQGALAAAERIGDRRATTFAAGSLGLITAFGPVAAAEGIERCRTLRRRVADHPIASATLLRYEAVLHAMQGRIDEARALHADGLRAIDDLGNHWASANTAWSHSALELLGGAPERAEAAARASLELFREMGATNPGSSAAAFLAVALVRQGRHEEALRYADLAAAWAAPDDIASQVGQLGARAHALAARAELEHAEAAAREAVRLSERSDDISQRGDASWTSRLCWIAPAASAKRLPRSGTRSPSTGARATSSPPPAPTQRWNASNTTQPSPTRHRRRAPHINAPARVWPSRREAGRPRGLEAENVSDCV